MMSARPHNLDSFIDILPWPSVLIADTGCVMRLNPRMEAAGVRLSEPGENHLRSLFPEYLVALKGDPCWLTPQEVEVTRQTAFGPLHERLWIRRLGSGSLMVVSDETRLRELEAGHAQNARLASLGFLLASVSHEINNPLSAISSIVQILQSKRGISSEVRQKGIAQIAENTRRLLLLTRKLTSFARVDDTTRTRFSIDTALDEAFLQLKYDSLGETVALEHQRDERGTVLGYQGQMQQVFFNLFLNAAQAMQGHGTIRVTTELVAPVTLIVTISDTGPGIPAPHFDRIFKPFFTTKRGSGIGLGLAISDEIVHEHGGTIIARNRPDAGALFQVTLPVARE
jgi:two-component system, NtrC family, sensor kinase